MEEYHKSWLHKNLVTILESDQPMDVPTASKKTQKVKADALNIVLLKYLIYSPKYLIVCSNLV